MYQNIEAGLLTSRTFNAYSWISILSVLIKHALQLTSVKGFDLNSKVIGH